MTVIDGSIRESIFYAPYTAGEPPWESSNWYAKNAWGSPQITGSLVDIPAIPAVIEKLWSGYEWLFVDGLYEKSTDITSDLVWTSVKPVVGKSYSADALITISFIYQGALMPLDGLYAYSDLILNTGGDIPWSGTAAFGSLQNNNCMIMNGDSQSCLYNTSFVLTSPFSVSFWIYYTEGECLLAVGSYAQQTNIEVLMKQDCPALYTSGTYPELVQSSVNIKDGWHHICFTYDGTTRKLYVDKVVAGESSLSVSVSGGLLIGSNFTTSMTPGRDGYLTGGFRLLRIYDRVVSSSDIDALYLEGTLT